MKRLSLSGSHGFTIVELLVVIVVISILASVSIVSYQGIQNRAEKTKTLSIIQTYRDALIMYETMEGGYPTTATYCLGSGYTDKTGDSNPDCRWGSGNVNPNTAFNTALSKYVQGTLGVTQKPVMNGSAGVVGMYFMNDALGKLDGATKQNWLVYAVPDKHCGMNVPQLTSTYPEFVSKSNDTVSENWGAGGLCWIALD